MDPTAQLAPGPKPTRVRRVSRFLFGEDVFISYARRDGSAYVQALAARLQAEHGLSVDADILATTPGARIPAKLLERVRRAGLLVVVGGPAALASENVREEIRTFRDGRPDAALKVVCFGAPPGPDCVWAEEVAGLPVIIEPAGGWTGRPADDAVSVIAESRRFTRRAVRLRRLLVGTLALILLLAGAGIGVSSWFGIRAARSAELARALNLVQESIRARSDPNEDLRLSLERAVESVRLHPTPEGHAALRAALTLLPELTRREEIAAARAWVTGQGVVAVEHELPAAASEGGSLEERGPAVGGVEAISMEGGAPRRELELKDGRRLVGADPIAATLSGIAYVMQSDAGIPELRFGEPERTIPVMQPEDMVITEIAVSSDGRYAAVSRRHGELETMDSALQVIDTEDGGTVHLPLRGRIDAIDFVRDEPFLVVAGNRRVATGDVFSFVEFWPLEERGKSQVLPELRRQESILSMDVATRLTFAVATARSVRVYKPDSVGRYVTERWVPLNGGLPQVAFDASGRYLWVADCNLDARQRCLATRWDVSASPEEQTLWSEHPFGDFTFTTDGGIAGLVMSAGSPEVRLWSGDQHHGRTPALCEGGLELRTFGNGVLGCVHQDGVQLWPSEKRARVPASPEQSTVRDLYDGRFLVTLAGSDSGPLLIHDLERADGGVLSIGDEREMFDVHIDLRHGRAVTVSDDGFLSIWDIATKREVTASAFDAEGRIILARISPDGRRVLIGRRESAEIRDLADGSLLHSLPLGDRSDEATWDPCGDHVGIVTRNFIQVWSAATGELIDRIPPNGNVKKLAFTPDCRHLVASLQHGEADYLTDRAFSLRLWLFKSEDLLAEGERWLAATRVKDGDP